MHAPAEHKINGV